MTRPRTTIGKRNVQQMKREKAQAKQERRAARRDAPEAGDAEPVDASEGELIEELAGLSKALESGELTPAEFEDRRERIRAKLEQVAGL